jgi:hypothetical protein
VATTIEEFALRHNLTACNLPMWITSASNTDHCSTLPDFEMFRSLSAHELSPNIYFLKA